MASPELDVSKLNPGDPHYMAYVGPPTQYDFMGATQFRLLCALGLRAQHRVLDFGCGSLRAGRFLLSYLDPERYCGVEPNRWLIDDAIANQIGADLVRIKKPRFDHNAEFRVDAFGAPFDYIVAQSVFSHTAAALAVQALRNFAAALSDRGRVVATFIEGETDFTGEGWVYPGCVGFRPATIERFAGDAGLQATRLPWYHPRQTWYVLARRADLLPTPEQKRLLTGAVLFDPEFAASIPHLERQSRGRLARAWRCLLGNG